MLLGEKYRLELHWSSAVFEKEGVCVLKGAFFSGPALNDAEKINDNDSIMLDFYNQYFILVRNVYVGRLSWGRVEYKKDKVFLYDAKITHATELNRVPKLEQDDFLVIDTKGHDAEEHMYNMVYKTYVVNDDKNPYNFRSKK
jgi:hypothetical protein